MSKITKDRLFEILNARHLNNPYSKLASIPSFNNFKDINIATKRVKQAILSGEKITIVGDYDVDGIVSTTIMLDFFNSLGIKVDYIIPNRFEHGYGLSVKIVDNIDSGLKNDNVSKFCKFIEENGCETIRTMEYVYY